MKRLLDTWFATLLGTLIAAALLSASGTVLGQQLPAVVGVHGATWHAANQDKIPGSRGYNDANPGAYARWANGFTIGAYRNSLFRNSAYVGWTITDQADRFGLLVGAVSGYDKLAPPGQGTHEGVRCDKANGCRTVSLKSVILPMIAPSVRIPVTDRASVRLWGLIGGGKPAVHLSLEWRL